MIIEDVSPKAGATTISVSGQYQSISGKGLCVALSSDGLRAYLGGHSGVWRSDDGGLTWRHPERPQPPEGVTTVPGALLVPNVYDLLVSPINPDVVLAATGRDPRRPAQNGIYRSTDGAQTWTRVHQFTRTVGGVVSVASVGRLAVAPDDPNRMYAAGQFALGISIDGGATWTEVVPQGTAGGNVNHVVAHRAEGAIRRVYAVGSRVWYSTDGGASWRTDPAALSLGFPTDAVGESSRALSLDPTTPTIIYLARGSNELWRGDFSAFETTGAAVWRRLPSPPANFPGTTASGGDFVLAHAPLNVQYQLLMSDRRSVNASQGDPTSIASWRRFDGGDVHLDPHGIAVTRDFRAFLPGTPEGGTFGRVLMVNDGGVVVSTDGGRTWTHASGLSTLGLVNVAVLPRPGAVAPGICIGMGDNSGYYTTDGGVYWKTQDYVGGDNDCCFADPRQSNRLIVFSPRSGNRGLFVYSVGEGQLPDAFVGTSGRQDVPGPPQVGPDAGAPRWNAVSHFYNLGYRPLVLTLRDEAVREQGDFVVIRYTENAALLVRTTAMASMAAPGDWVTSATSEGPGVKAFQQGPPLPVPRMSVVQAAGGHAAPVFYVGDPEALGRVWKWTAGMAVWQQIVPAAAPSPQNPTLARRFFVHPYLPSVLYVLGASAVHRTDNGGASWVIDERLQRALTENGAFPVQIPDDGNPGQALVRDMAFDPNRPLYRFAVGPAGVFYTLDGVRWAHLLLSSAMAMRPNNLAYDPYSDFCGRALYVSTSNRGLLRVRTLPPEWPFPIGALVAAEGRITLLRVHDVGTKYGPPHDQMDVEVVIMMDTEVEKAFGFTLRTDGNARTHRGMLQALRDAFNANRRLRIEYVRQGCRSGRILRVIAR